jgi:pyridoxal phosphate enzyme (YggS family)
MTSLAENLERLEAEIGRACGRAGRARAEVELMAVSKTYPAATLAEAAALGLALFGENRVQEFAAKAHELSECLHSYQLRAPSFRLFPGERLGYRESKTNEITLSETELEPLRQHAPAHPIHVHLIGHLQSNKALRAVELFDAVDSVDTLRLAERLNEAAARCGKRLPVLIEVKLSPEESKAGLAPESGEAARLLERLPDLAHLEARGLMTIAPFGVPEDETRTCFRRLRAWRERWSAAYPRLAFDVLSMGMSGDFPLAIEEGATRIRIGTALFGRRAPYTGAA